MNLSHGLSVVGVERLVPLLVAQEDGAPAASRTLWEYIASGGPVGFMIIVLSVIALALVIIHFWQAQIGRLAPQTLIMALEARLREGDVPGAINVCRAPEYDSFLARLFGTAMLRCTRSPFGFLEIRTALEDSGHREVDRLSRTNDFIGIIGAVGPMLGLLGTVFGMIGAFSTIGNLEGAARSRGLADYMSLALVTTAMGLAVAIPCTVAFTLFKRRIERITGDVADIADGLAMYLEHGKASGETKAPQRQAPRPAPSRPEVVKGAANS